MVTSPVHAKARSVMPPSKEILVGKVKWLLRRLCHEEARTDGAENDASMPAAGAETSRQGVTMEAQPHPNA
jgi:hypothetical protein